MSTNPRFRALQEEVTKAFLRAGHNPSDSVRDTLAIVGAGYLDLLVGALGPLFPPVPPDVVGASIVDRYRSGAKPSPPKGMYTQAFRDIADIALSQRHLTWLDHE